MECTGVAQLRGGWTEEERRGDEDGLAWVWGGGWKVGHTDWRVKGQLRREDGGSDGWWTDNWVIWGRQVDGLWLVRGVAGQTMGT